MSIRHYTSDADAFDDNTFQWLGSRFRKVAEDAVRRAPHRHRRDDEEFDRAPGRKPRRPRDRHEHA